MKRNTGWAYGMVVGGGIFLSLYPVGAQQTSTASAKPQKPSPPNALPVQDNVLPEQRDPALNTPVNVAANGQTVQELLESLNAPERPKLQAQEPVGWQSVTVYARQQPIEKLMAGLKTLFNDVWVHNVSNPAQVRYVLKSTGRGEEYDRELYRLTLERGAEPLMRLTEYLRTPEEEYARQYDKYWKDHIESPDPLIRGNLYYLARSGPRDGMAFLTTLSPEQRFLLFSEGSYFLPISAMTDLQVRKAHNMGLASARLQERIGRLLEGETPEDQAAIGEQFGLQFSARVHPVTGALLGCGYSNGVGGLEIASTGNLPPPAPLLAVRGNPYHFSPGSKMKLPVYPDLQKQPFPSAFHLKQGKEYAWRDVLMELHKHISMPIYSDDFHFTMIAQDRLYGGQFDEIDARLHPLAARPRLTNTKLPEALDALCNQYGYLWWYQNGTLFFRSRTWFIEQLYEVPPPVLAYVRHQLGTEGKLNAEGVTALSTLTKKQVMGLSFTNMTYGPEQIRRREEVGERSYDTDMRSNTEADSGLAWEGLQVFALLNEEQKNKVFSPEGLVFTEMPPAAQQRVFHALWTRQSISLLNQPEKVHLRVDQRIDPPANADSPCQANLGLSLSKGIDFGAAVAIRIMPAAPKQ